MVMIATPGRSKMPDSAAANFSKELHFRILAETGSDRCFNYIIHRLYLEGNNSRAGPSRVMATFYVSGLLDESQVAVVSVPTFWEQDLAVYHSVRASDEKYVGYLSYAYPLSSDARHQTATTMHYRPKECLWPGLGRGLPYFPEAITTSNMKSRGFTHIMTTLPPESSRIKQLKRVGLPIGTEIPIDYWLMGLLRGGECDREHARSRSYVGD